jgi:transcriptional regulator GlxA family with amidase domain
MGDVGRGDKAGARDRKGAAAALRVGFILTPQFTLLPFAAMVDALRLAADDGDGSRPIHCQWLVIAPTLTPISASCGVEVRPTELFSDPGRFDYIVVVSGLLKYAPDQRVLDYIKAADKAGTRLVGVGTGSFTMLRAGLLKGRRCCVSWYHYQDLLNEFPDVIPVADQLFVVDGRYITCAGGAVAIDLASWIIQRHMGPAQAQKSLHIMIVDRARPAAFPQPQPPLAYHIADARVLRAVLLIEQHLNEPLSLSRIAQHLNVSKRQLERLFHTHVGKGVQRYSRMLRVHYGLWLLADSDRTITEISQECGFSDASHFIRCFRHEFSVAPLEMRRAGRSEIHKHLRRFDGARRLGTAPAHRSVGAPNEMLLRERRPYVT